MPCFSSVQTKVSDVTMLAQALSILGYGVGIQTNRIRAAKDGSVMEFTRSGSAEAFQMTGDRAGLPAVLRKYAEVGVRSFAARRGYGITENDGTTMVLVNRRG